MKKVLSMCLLAGVAMFVFASCHKDCVCKKTIVAAGNDTTITYDARSEYSKKECESLSHSDSTVFNNSKITFECTYGN